MSDYYSDEALALQAEMDRLKAAGEPIPLALYCGIAEPRVKATAAERCVCCGLDARDDEGGEERYGVRWCFICVGRGHPEPQDTTTTAEPLPVAEPTTAERASEV